MKDERTDQRGGEQGGRARAGGGAEGQRRAFRRAIDCAPQPGEGRGVARPRALRRWDGIDRTSAPARE